MKSKWFIAGAFFTVLLAVPAVVTADIVAGFEGTAGTTTVDGYKGMTGLGWNGAWVEKGSGTGSVVGTLMTSDDALDYMPFDSDNDNYLRIRTTNNSPTPALGSATNYKGSVNRNYNHSSGDVDFLEPYQVKFSVRPEDLSNWGESATNDVFRVYDSLGTNVYGASTTSTRFYVTAWGGPTDPYNSEKHCWVVYSGATKLKSYVYIADNHIYDFVIDIYPDTGKWDVTITDRDFDLADIDPFYYNNNPSQVKATYTKTGANWYAAGATGANAPTAICFGVYEGSAVDEPGGGKYNTMSVDDIVISQLAPPIPDDIPGDADGNGQVDAEDAKRLAQNWGATVVVAPYESLWEMGDFNADGTVDAKDASILAANWGYVWSQAAPAGGEGAVAAVPEPGTGALLVTLLAGVATAFGRRRFVA